MGQTRVRPVRDRHDLHEFIRLPHTLYAGDQYWVPPLDTDVAATLAPERNPFFQHAERELFLAEQDGKPAGRIAAIVDRNYVAYHHENIGFFGFFESSADYAVAEALFGAARTWLRDKGMTAMRGPANPSLNDEAGMLLDGFDSSPLIKMTYNPRYYLEFCERFGMTKAKDLYAYSLTTSAKIPDKLVRVIEHIKHRAGLVIRPINLHKLADELRLIKEIYNDAWSENWDFAPMTDAEIDDTARKLKDLIVPELVPLVLIDGEPAGMSIALPDYNQVIKDMGGKLNIVKFLLNRSKIDAARLWALGVKAKFRRMGLDALLYYETFLGARKKGFAWGEVSWILEDNVDIIRPIQVWGSKLYKKYRIFQIAA
jgi:hypothetical protein